MADNPQLTALHRLLDSVNKQSASNSASMGKISSEQTALRQDLETTKIIANRALQMCDTLSARVSALEAKASGQ